MKDKSGSKKPYRYRSPMNEKRKSSKHSHHRKGDALSRIVSAPRGGYRS